MKKISNVLAVLLAVALLASLLAGCGSSSSGSASASSAPAAASSAATADTGSVVNIGITGTLSSANPLMQDQTEVSKLVGDLQFMQLCEMNQEMEFVNMLADSITTEDNIHFVVHLNENAVWSDGEPVTANDVVFTVLKFASPVIGNSTMLLYAFEGTDDDTGFVPEGTTAADFTGVVAQDEHTVVFNAKYEMPLTSFMNTYGRYIHVLPEHVLGGMSDAEIMTTDYFDAPTAVSGPYVLTGYDVDHYVTFSRNEAYWNGVANIEKLNLMVMDGSSLYAALSSGEIDLAQQTTAGIPYDDYENVQKLSNVTTYEGSMLTTQSLFIQTQSITDVRVRQALLCGIDRETLVSGYLNGYGEVVDGFVASASPYYSSDVVPVAYDKEKAAALVAEAAADGYDTSKVIRFYTWSTDTTMTNAAAYIVSGLQEIGLNVEIHTVDLATLMSVAGTDEVDMFAVQYTYSPVDYYPDVAWLLGGEGSWTGYYNEDLDLAMQDAQTTTDIEQIRLDYRMVDEAMQKDVPMINLYNLGALGAVSTRLQGAVPNVYGTFVNVNEWTLAK